MPLGNSITVGIGDTGGFPGYRDWLYYDLEGDGYDVDFVGSMTDASGTHDPHHEGHSGKTARWINGWNNDKTAHRYDPIDIDDWLIDHDPNIVLYFIGTNDLSPPDFDFPPADVAEDVDETLSKIYGYDAEITVFLAQIILNRDNIGDINDDIQAYNLLLEGVAATWDTAGYNIVLVDMENALSYDDYYDAVHPND